MNMFNKFLKAVSALWVAAAFCSFGLSAQETSSRWMFGKFVPADEQTWGSAHYMKATTHGEGVMKAEDASGNDLPTYRIVKGRAAAGPFKAGDSFSFEVPAGNLQAGSFVSFDATLSAEPGAPKQAMRIKLSFLTNERTGSAALGAFLNCIWAFRSLEACIMAFKCAWSCVAMASRHSCN
jgi:hypothetical protein